jgi:F420-non-reducing hydrogenase iron-sulfur subunit
MFATARDLAELLGIEPGRVRLEWISSAEGTRFAEVAAEFTQEIKSLGPLKIKEAV